MHRFLDVGGRVDHDRRAEAGFVGERAALEAPGDGLADAVAQRAAACGVEVECTLEDRRQCAGILPACMTTMMSAPAT